MFYPVCFIISIGGTMISFENSETFKNKTVILEHITITLRFEPHREKTGFLPMRKQRRRSASR